MKAGVATVPWGVVNIPVRVAPTLLVISKVNMSRCTNEVIVPYLDPHRRLGHSRVALLERGLNALEHLTIAVGAVPDKEKLGLTDLGGD